MQRCANPVSPTGGPKDTTPPGLLKAEPPLFTKNFKVNKIRLYFDEFISLKDLQNQLLISPPMNENPEIKIKGKSVVIEFQEPLKDSTTYNIFLGNAIVDITEENPYPNFRYVFSTGNVLDSMTYKGIVKDAFTMEPVKSISVMLYINNNDTIPFDSLPYFVKPYYMSRTFDDGTFEFANLPDNVFKLFVLEDGNSNLLFDQTSERIAFSNKLIIPYYIPSPVEPDTSIIGDSLLMDSLTVDTLIPDLFKAPDPLRLFLFEENDSLQRFLKASLIKENHMAFIFRKATYNAEIIPLNIAVEEEWKLVESNKTKDTINWWIYNLPQDSITFQIADNGIILDTIELAMVKRVSKRDQKKQEEKAPSLKVNFSKKPPLPNPEGKLEFSFNYPIRDLKPEGFEFMEDTNSIEFPDIIFSNEIKTKAYILHKWKESTSYSIMIPDSSFTDILGRSHDTLTHKFKTKALADFGNIILNATLPASSNNYIVQLLSKDKVIREYHLQESEKITISFLLPGDYRIRAINDQNNNLQWDPGDYIYGIQPERVFYFNKTVTARANWDVEESWDLSLEK
ncbi:MAG: Ig-like domain-containing protein [Bacteroidales bacterium]|nr:Ig-like domain-containing protein [Bacteroidales bacterium]